MQGESANPPTAYQDEIPIQSMDLPKQTRMDMKVLDELVKRCSVRAATFGKTEGIVIQEVVAAWCENDHFVHSRLIQPSPEPINERACAEDGFPVTIIAEAMIEYVANLEVKFEWKGVDIAVGHLHVG